MLRTGIMPTRSGLVFLVGGDSRIRAIDERDGRVLWATSLPGTSRGIAAMFQARQRQYLLVTSVVASTETLSPDTPRGLIAFALRP